MPKRKTINLTDLTDCTATAGWDGRVWLEFDNHGQKEANATHVRVLIPRWFLSSIGRAAHDALKREDAELSTIRRYLSGGS